MPLPQLLLLAAALGAAAVAAGEPPRFVASWQGATRALPNGFLPDVPLLGNGHIGVLMDTTTAGPAAGHTSSAVTIRPSTRCNSVEGHTGKLLNVGLSQCEKLCAKSPSCAAFSHGEAGSCFRPPQSGCFADLKDTSQCTPGGAGFTSGVRAPNGPAPVPRGGLNATVNLQFGSNAMWALQTCDNASASDEVCGTGERARLAGEALRPARLQLDALLRIPQGLLPGF